VSEKTVVVRINEDTYKNAVKEAAKFKRNVSGQLDWWISIGLKLEKEYPEYFAEIVKKLHHEE